MSRPSLADNLREMSALLEAVAEQIIEQADEKEAEIEAREREGDQDEQ